MDTVSPDSILPNGMIIIKRDVSLDFGAVARQSYEEYSCVAESVEDDFMLEWPECSNSALEWRQVDEERVKDELESLKLGGCQLLVSKIIVLRKSLKLFTDSSHAYARL